MIKSIFLETTRMCNLNCIFCSNQSKKPLDDELSLNTFLELIYEFNDLGIKNLRLYGGEPLLSDKTLEIIKLANYLNLSISIYSNGIFLEDRIVKALKSNCVRKIFISVDGSKAEIHDKIRGKPGSFDEVIKNINVLVGEGIIVDVLFTLCKINMHEISSTYNLLKSLGVSDIKTNFVTRVGRAKTVWEDIALTKQEIIQCVYEMAYIHKKLYDRKPKRRKCNAAVDEIFLASNGNVYPCALFVTPQFCAGNVREKKLGEILSAPRGLFKEVGNNIEKQLYCGKCEKKELCGGGCRARATFENNGDLKSSDFVSCILNKEIIQCL